MPCGSRSRARAQSAGQSPGSLVVFRGSVPVQQTPGAVCRRSLERSITCLAHHLRATLVLRAPDSLCVGPSHRPYCLVRKRPTQRLSLTISPQGTCWVPSDPQASLLSTSDPSRASTRSSAVEKSTRNAAACTLCKTGNSNQPKLLQN